jgi:hypothetical protein
MIASEFRCPTPVREPDASNRSDFFRTTASAPSLLYDRCCRMAHSARSTVLSFPLRTSELRGVMRPFAEHTGRGGGERPKGKSRR